MKVRHVDRLAAVDLDRAFARVGQSQDRAQSRRTARAVAAEQGYDFAMVHEKIDAMQDVRLAVPGLQAGDFQRWLVRHEDAAVPIYASITCGSFDTSS